MTVCPASGRTQTDARIGLGRGERFGQTIALAGLHMKEERAAPHGIAAATCEINARVGVRRRAGQSGDRRNSARIDCKHLASLIRCDRVRMKRCCIRPRPRALCVDDRLHCSPGSTALQQFERANLAPPYIAQARVEGKNARGEEHRFGA